MGKGFLNVEVRTGDDALPVGDAHVIVADDKGIPKYETYTDQNGVTEELPLPAPDVQYTLDPEYTQPAYSVWEVTVHKEGFVRMHIHGVEIVDTQLSILPVRMEPLVDEPGHVTDREIDIPPIALLDPDTRQIGPTQNSPARNNPSQNSPARNNPVQNVSAQAPAARDALPASAAGAPLVLNQVIIPDYITVHLGAPTNAAARNVRVKFPDYIKNVASSEIYSTWPESSLLANIHAITSFALNRVYTEWYRGRGFPFDITGSTSYDQAYRDGAMIFGSISRLVDEYFNVYVRRIGFQNPFFTAFCNGTTVTCAGLSQWGTVTLANRGYTPIQILRYYYPDDVELVASGNITAITETFPGTALRVGSQGDAVRRIQNQLNRIRVNYPLIPLISNPDGVFRTDTEAAVRAFQRAFDMAADGIVGRATWNRISFIYVGVTKLAELNSEGERVTIGQTPPEVILSQGASGEHVRELQFILNVISPFYPSVPTVIKDGVFGPTLKNAVIEFQKTFNLTADGVVGPTTWNKLYAVYRGIDQNVPVPPTEPPTSEGTRPYPGTPLRLGATGSDVRLMQSYLNIIRIVYTSIPQLVVDGQFGPATRDAVIAFQNEFLLAPDGVIGPITWDYIVEQYLIATASSSVSLEYPGTPLRRGSAGSNVRLMQSFLAELRAPYPSLPAIAVDGIFGPNTEAAVIAFQTLFGLTPDGIIGPLTWNEIVRQRGLAF